ncbi:serine hydrolase [Microbacterium sp. P07]|uniref:serine hydrolase n=1 Tax=Microbacterium sp. P07 TaxID=3366952 RepID=UPI003746E9B5
MPFLARTRSFRSVAAALSIAALLVTTACAATPEAEPEDTAAPVTIPGTAVGQQAEWVLAEINGEPSEQADFEARFDPIMFEQMSAADLQQVFEQLRAAAPWSAIGYEGTETQARVTIEAAAVTYDMSVSVGDDGSMNGLFFGEPQAPRTPAASWDELEAAIAGAPYDVSLQVTEVGATEPRMLLGEPSRSPIGSIFKLWVLGAVVDAVDAGTLTWDDPLTIDAEVRSLPSGELQNLPDGATVTVREAAEKMIQISDNTATDALIRAVGRDAVEAALVDMGHATPEANTPFLTTREMFWMLFGDAALRDRWASGDPAAREAVLAEIPAGVPDLANLASAQPGWPAGVDWFATHDDIARAHVALQEKAQTPAGAPLRDLLAKNPGIEFGDDWTYVAFKGGSSVGVLAGSWYLERDGAEPIVLTVLARADDGQTLTTNQTAVFGFVEDAAGLLLQD